MKTVCLIENDLHAERSGFFRAFYAADPDAATMCTVFGYCTGGHSFRTIRETVSDFRKFDKATPVFRNGKRLA